MAELFPWHGPSWSGPEATARFDGATYDHEVDGPRLNLQLQRVYDVMKDGKWRTLSEIGDVTGYPEASVSARIRDFRKSKWGGYRVERRRETPGLWKYKLFAKTA